MNQEQRFQHWLDLSPDDSGIRMMLADWLDERSDVRAPGCRWLAEHGKRPRLQEGLWKWWTGFDSQTPSSIAEPLMQFMEGYVANPNPLVFAYESREAAESAMSRAMARKGRPISERHRTAK